MQMQAGQLWQAVLGDMQTRLPRNAFENWLRPTILIAFENDVATVAAPNLYSADTLKNRYADQIERLLTEFVGRPVRVEFTVPSGVDTDDAATDLGAFAPSIPQLPDLHLRAESCHVRSAVPGPDGCAARAHAFVR